MWVSNRRERLESHGIAHCFPYQSNDGHNCELTLPMHLWQTHENRNSRRLIQYWFIISIIDAYDLFVAVFALCGITPILLPLLSIHLFDRKIWIFDSISVFINVTKNTNEFFQSKKRLLSTHCSNIAKTSHTYIPALFLC